jgi:hypothetical protein
MDHTEQKLNWQNLRRNKCPKCNGEMQDQRPLLMLGCTACAFKISHEAFSRIVGKMNKEGLARSDYRQAEEVQDLRKDSLGDPHQDHCRAPLGYVCSCVEPGTTFEQSL